MAAATAALLGGGALASIAGGIGNYVANQSAADRAATLQNQALQQWIAVQIPDPEQQKLALQKFVVEGKLDPKLEQAISANPSQFQKIVTNPGYASAQDKALSQLEDIGNSGGLRLQDKAALQDAQLHQQTQDRANRQAIGADLARRGLGGSGFDVAAQLQGQQGTSDQAANNSLKIAAGAQDRALQSIQQAGGLASQYRTQDFGEQAQKATAADKINLFNTQNLQNVQERNIASQNAAAASNLSQQQKTSDLNTNQSNYEQEYNKKLAQQQFEDQTKKAAGISGQYGNLAQNAQQQGQNTGNLFSNVGSSLAGAANSGANYYSNLDDYLKKKAAGTTQ